MESKTSNDSLQHSNFLDETDIYNRNIPIAPLTGRDAIWNQIVKDIISAGEKKQKITLGSSTAAAIVDEPQIQEAMQRDEDSRLSSHIFSVLDKVMTLPLMRSLDLRFAQLVVLGMESHGKSTLLERLLKLVLFPKGKGRCSTTIQRAELRRGPGTLARVSIRKRSTLEESHVENDLPLDGLEDCVRRLMNTITREIEHRLIAIEHEVLIRITREDLPNLDLVDLPGIVSMNDGNNSSQDLAIATYDLAESVVKQEKDHSIFLLVVDVQSQINHSKAAELVRQQQVEQQTIGVFTKLDMLEAENEDEDLSQTLAAKLQDQSLLKTNGWLACANREPPRQLLTTAATAAAAMVTVDGNSLQDYRFALMARYEGHLLLKDGAFCRSLSEQMRSSQTGMPVIRGRVQILFEDFLLDAWVPQCIDSLNTALRSLYAGQAAIGLPILEECNPDLIETQQRLLSAVSDKARKHIHPQYNTDIFQAWSADRLQQLVMDMVKQAMTRYISRFDLCNNGSHNDADSDTTKALIHGYTKLIRDMERGWEKRYRFKHLAGVVDQREDYEEGFTEEDLQAMTNYAEDCKESSPRDKLYIPAMEAAKNHLMTLVNHLCSFWQPQHLIDMICLAVDNKQEVSQDEYLFEDFDKGAFLNLLHRFPHVKDSLTDQVLLVWESEQDVIKAALRAMITDHMNESADSPYAWLQRTHCLPNHAALLGQRQQHMILLQWTQRGKAMAHNVTSRYLDLMRDMLAKVMRSLYISSDCFTVEELQAADEEGEDGAVGSDNYCRVDVLQRIVDCFSVIETLLEVIEDRQQLIFQRRRKFNRAPRSFANDRCVQLKGHNHYVYCVHVMPDGMTIVSGSRDKTVKVWNSHDNSCIMTIPCPDWVYSLLAIDDQTILAGLYDGNIVKMKIDYLYSFHRSIVITCTGHS